MDRRFRGPTPEKSIKTPNITIPEKDLKKILVKINLKKPSASSQLDEIDHTLDRPEEIKIYRSQGEGSRPLFAREDIKVNSEDVETTSRRSHRTESDYTRRSSDYSNNRETPKRSRSRDRRSHYRSRSRSQDSLRRNYVNKPSSSSSSRRDYESHSRNRRSRSPRRSRTRSRSRSSRREFGRRRNSPERRHRYDRQDYRHHDRRHRRSRSPPRSHSRYPSHSTPLDPAAIGAIPLIFPPDLNFYGHEDGMWFQAPIRGPPPPMMIPRGLIPSRGMFRAPLYGMRPPVPPRPPPYLYPQRLPEYNSLQREAFERSRRLP